ACARSVPGTTFRELGSGKPRGLAGVFMNEFPGSGASLVGGRICRADHSAKIAAPEGKGKDSRKPSIAGRLRPEPGACLPAGTPSRPAIEGLCRLSSRPAIEGFRNDLARH